MSRSFLLRWLAAAWALCVATLAAGAAAPAARWQCSPPGSATVAPGIAEAARDYLDRVEALYPSQLLGLVRAGERVYLLNSIDIEWGTRTRLALLALRLPEPYLVEERLDVAPGGRPPPGGYICLAAARAGREGLTRTPLGEIVLAAGQSVHLVNPQEPEVAVEVRAARDRPLNLGDIFQRSARAGIYAGLTGGAAGQPGGSATIERPDGTLIFRTASVGASASPAPVAMEVSPAAEPKPVPTPVVVAVAPPPPPVEVQAAPAPTPAPAVEIAVAPTPIESASPVVEVVPTVVAAIPVAPAAPVVQASAPPAANPVPEPAMARAEVRPPAVAVSPIPTDAGQSYDDYAKAMKTLMALKRSGSVRSVGEMTYVHPAVEVLRGRMRQ